MDITAALSKVDLQTSAAFEGRWQNAFINAQRENEPRRWQGTEDDGCEIIIFHQAILYEAELNLTPKKTPFWEILITFLILYWQYKTYIIFNNLMKVITHFHVVDRLSKVT